MSDAGRVREWVSWACGKVDERFAQGRAYMETGCRALAEEQLMIGRAMLELLSGFQEMVIDDRRTDQERTGDKDS